MRHYVGQQTALGAWVRNLLARAHPNVVVVALAAKLAESPGLFFGAVMCINRRKQQSDGIAISRGWPPKMSVEVR